MMECIFYLQSHISISIIANLTITDNEVERLPLNGNNSNNKDDTNIDYNNSNPGSSWKKWGMAGALVALLGYMAVNNHSSGAVNNVDLLSHALPEKSLTTGHQSKSGKIHKKEEHKMTKAEMNEALFDEQRKSFVAVIVVVAVCLFVQLSRFVTFHHILVSNN